MTAVAIPFGVAAALAFQGPAASAAGVSSTDPAAIAAAAAAAAPARAASIAGAASQARSTRQILTARLLATSHPAAASVANYGKAVRMRAYRWAAKRAGHPYVYGGTGPGFDCSGLVMMAYRHAGIRLPRTTYEMLASRMLVRVIHPRMGDLAFYGPGHVELFRRWGYTFGAHDYGSPVGLIHYGGDWRPTAFYRIRVRAVSASKEI